MLSGFDLNEFFSGDIWSTVLLISLLLLIRTILVRGMERSTETLSETRRRWISIVRNTSVVLIGLGLVFIWSPELTTFALSLTAFAVALVVATKEFLLCMVGAVYRTSVRPFNVGDWIELDGVRGEVIAEGILSTRLQELGQGSQRYTYSGRILAMPNSLLLTHTVRNENFRKKFVHHAFSIITDPGLNVSEVKDMILKEIAAASSPFDDVAERYWAMVRHKLHLDLPSRNASVSFETNNTAKIVIGVTYFCPTDLAISIEERVAEVVLQYVHTSQRAS